MDVFSKKKRKKIMQSITAKNTKPEENIAKTLKRAGYKIEMHCNDLPGKPDIILKKYKLAIFVHGCFWHQHKGCKRCSMPKTNKKYWRPKLENNVKRFNAQRRSLNRKGWHVYVIWECQIKKTDAIMRKINYIFNRLGEI